MTAWIILIIIAFLACIVLYASDRPGHRRRRQNLDYEGLERREDDTAVDVLSRPIFKLHNCPKCNKVKCEPGCPPEECDNPIKEPFASSQK